MGESRDFKDLTKESFKRVKQDIFSLSEAIKENREFLIRQNKEFFLIKKEIEALMDEFKDLKGELASFKISSGNEGVINNHQQSSTTINNNQQQSTINNGQQVNNAPEGEFEPLEPTEEDLEDSTIINDDQQQSTMPENIINNHQQSSTMVNKKQAQNPQDTLVRLPLSEMKKELESKFNTLTDREFSVFMAVYQLEEQLPDVNYSDVSKLLNISEMTVRGYVNSLMAKKIPLEKRRMYNKKVFLSISPEFRALNLASFLLTLRLPKSNFNSQKTLKSF